MADYFVAQAGQTPEWPHTNWAIAASNIQDAVNVAPPGSTVLISNGTYRVPTNAVVEYGTNIVHFNKSLNLRGVSADPEDVVLDGEGLYRGIYFLPADSPTTVLIENLTITNCYANERGAGISIFTVLRDGTATVHNCIISGNVIDTAYSGSAYAGSGGGIFVQRSSTGLFVVNIDNCRIVGNRSVVDAFSGSLATGSDNSGGGIYFYNSGTISNCLIEDNLAYHGGGMIFRSYNYPPLIVNCVIRGNKADGNAGGVYANRSSGILRNCLLTHNEAGNFGSAYYMYNAGGHTGVIENCTIVDNFNVSAVNHRSQANMVLRNNIIYHNQDGNYAGTIPGLGTREFYNNNTTRNPEDLNAFGGGNINEPPKFVDLAGQNYGLQPTSPCVNAGKLYPAWMAEAVDLDRQTRVDRFSGMVDMGCYEYIPATTMFNFW